MSTSYVSTRNTSKTWSFEQVVFQGLAPDGGLFVPDKIPNLPSNYLTAWRHLNYKELCFVILSLYIPQHEIPSKKLKALIDKTYASSFRHEDIAPVKSMASVEGKPVYMLELFHGPTFAFKDIALQFVGNLFEYFLKRKKNTGGITVLGATSGDTGSAAIAGLRGKENIQVFILYPKGKVSDIQEKQMITVLDDNVHNVAVEGTFDDCQALVKEMFSDKSVKDTFQLGAVNSINFARILAQIVYYFYAYFRVTELEKNLDCKVSFSVPTGNFGDVLAGYYAKRMGLPIDELLVATNENDILHRFFTLGEYHCRPVQHTLSPSMDIGISSNFERFLYDIADNDCHQLTAWMKEFNENSPKKLTVTDAFLEKAQLSMRSESVQESTIRRMMNSVWVNEKYLMDPHTAIGYAAVALRRQRSKDNTTPYVIVGTAHPGKFLPTVTEALSPLPVPAQHPLLDELNEKPVRNQTLAKADMASLKKLMTSTLKASKTKTAKKKKSVKVDVTDDADSTVPWPYVAVGALVLGLVFFAASRRYAA